MTILPINIGTDESADAARSYFNGAALFDTGGTTGSRYYCPPREMGRPPFPTSSSEIGFQASDFDTLVDSPSVGCHELHQFELWNRLMNSLFGGKTTPALRMIRTSKIIQVESGCLEEFAYN